MMRSTLRPETPTETGRVPACHFTVIADGARMCNAPAAFRIDREFSDTVQRIYVDRRHLPAQLDRLFTDLLHDDRYATVKRIEPVEIVPTWPLLPPAVDNGCQWYEATGEKCWTRAKYLVTAHSSHEHYAEAGACGNHLAKQVLRMTSPERDEVQVSLIAE